MQLKAQQSFTIPPGQFAFLTTEETVVLIAFQIVEKNERIEVIGVRTSWLTWLRNSSFCRSISRNRRLARPSSAAAVSIWCDFRSSSAE